jgi:hypothetical protein
MKALDAFLAPAFAIGLAATAPVSIAEQAQPERSLVSHPVLGFQVRIPKAWNQAAMETATPHIAMRSPDRTANCIVSARENPPTKGKTQAQVEDGFTKPLSDTFWKANLFKQLQDVEIERVEALPHPSGTFLHMAVATGVDEGTQVTSLAGLMVAPGMNYVVVCSAAGAKADGYVKDFRSVVDSFRIAPEAKPN